MKKLLAILIVIGALSPLNIVSFSPRKKAHCCDNFAMQGLWYLLSCGCIRDCKKESSQGRYAVPTPTPIIQVPQLPMPKIATAPAATSPLIRSKDSVSIQMNA